MKKLKKHLPSKLDVIIRNRQAARRSIEKRKQELMYLKQENNELKAENKTLQNKIYELQNQFNFLIKNYKKEDKSKIYAVKSHLDFISIDKVQSAI